MKKEDNFAQNIDCGYTLEPPHPFVLTSTHDLCFGAKIRKKYTPVTSSFTKHKSGVLGGLNYTGMFA